MHVDGSYYLLLLPPGNDSVPLKLQNPRATGGGAPHLRGLGSGREAKGLLCPAAAPQAGVCREEAAGLAASRGAASWAGSCRSGG